MKDQWRGEKSLGGRAQLLPEFAALTRGWENHVLPTALLLAFDVTLAGDTGFVDEVTFLGHAVVGGVRFGVHFTVHFTYIETCWHSTQLLDAESSRVQRDEQKSALIKKQQCRGGV
jgi:hypothetical protein